MPYEVKNDHPDCSGFAVVKPETGELIACHPTKAKAQAHQRALYAAEPEARMKSMNDAQLVKVHDHLHSASGTANADAIEAHHLIAEEMRTRGLEHPDASDEIHLAVIEKSRVQVPIVSLSKVMSASEVNTIASMAAANGTKFADVYELLTSNGWMLRAVPADKVEPDMEEPEDEEVGNTALTAMQNALYAAFEEIADEYGQFDQTAGPNGAHYMSAEDNPFAEDGINCANCVFFEGGGRCEIVEGTIDPMAACKFWIVEGTKITVKHSGDARAVKAGETYSPPEGVRAEGKRALEWLKQGHAGKGFTDVGRRRASQLANGHAVSIDTIRRMAAYFTRHEGDLTAEGAKPGEKGYPSPGRVAWAAWGGDAGRSWANGILRSVDKALIVKAVDEKRFTLGPWYVPNVPDAHDEWTDPDELQSALWDYVKKGNREIRLQHRPGTKAGEWVEAMTMPFPIEVPMISPETGQMSKRQFPAGTVFLGVQWDDWAWDMVKAGQIRGYSIGGSALREKVDAPDTQIYVDLEEGE